jgi:Fe-S-cluster-containing hydrogenase component 2
MAVTVIPSSCPQNHFCPAVRVCPTDALVQEGFKAPVVDKDKCIDCGKCVKACPMGAIQGG